MATQYNNNVKRLEKYGITIDTFIDDFIKDKKDNKFPFLHGWCKNGHEFNMTVASLSNKFYQFPRLNLPDDKFCAECNKPTISYTEEKARAECTRLGFTFIAYDKNKRSVIYKCACGEESRTFAPNLSHVNRRAQCIKCNYKNSMCK